jgi:hypothetical protein
MVLFLLFDDLIPKRCLHTALPKIRFAHRQFIVGNYSHHEKLLLFLKIPFLFLRALCGSTLFLLFNFEQLIYTMDFYSYGLLCQVSTPKLTD